MFRYVFTLLLINTYYQSLGVPVEPKAHFLTFSLKTLADKCENQFLADHIKSRTEDCSVVAPPYLEKQLQCLMFYDINSQLCAAAPKLTLSADTTAKINEEQNINTLCYNLNNWTFTNFTDYPQYKGMVERYLRYPVTCGKICGAEEIVSDKANFFCKYFSWGNELLRNMTQANNESTISSTQTAAPLSETAEKNTEEHPPIDHIQGDNKLIQNNLAVSSDPIRTSSVGIEASTKNEIAKPEQTSNKMVDGSVASEPVKTDDADLDVNKINEHADIMGQDVPMGDVQEKPLDDGLKQVAKPSVGQEAQSNSGVASKDTVIDTPKLKPNDEADYPDTDDSKDPQGEEEDEDQGNVGQVQVHDKNLDKAIEPIFDLSSKTIQEYYPNPIQEGFSDDDDDHFFSFFLTVVVVVVLLYILYHNKSKVSKVFLGLIFEGRQSGRRRTSRGHAYRRLDTLEQAMTNKSTAPPSKIIY